MFAQWVLLICAVGADLCIALDSYDKLADCVRKGEAISKHLPHSDVDCMMRDAVIRVEGNRVRKYL